MVDLKSFPFFSTLPTREVETLKKSSRFKKFASGTTVLEEGEPLKEFLILMEGKLSLVKSHGGRKKTLLTLDPGDSYGEVEVLNGTVALGNLIGYQEFHVMFIQKEEILRLIGLYPGFAREARETYARRAKVLLEEGLSETLFGQVITFFNVKGGAGKSVISANVGTLMARKWKKKVALIDLNLAFGDQGILLSLPSEKNIYELSRQDSPIKLSTIEEQLTHHSSGLNVLLPPPIPELAEKIKPEFVSKVIELLRANYDFVSPSF